MILTTLAASALAGQLFINGTAVEPSQVAGVRLQKVNVSVDGHGNILIDAPGYKIEVGGNPPPPPGNAGMATAPPSSTLSPDMNPSGVAKAKWWLVTEDNGSTGHTVEVLVNNQLVHTVRSGDPQKIVDIGAWLKLGGNAITMRSNSQGATGGTLYVFVGSGNDKSGTVVMDAPQVQFGLGTSRSGPYQRDYSLNVH